MERPKHPQRRPRILFMSEAVSLAHLGRPLALAHSLDAGAYEIHFATGGNFSSFAESDGLTRHEITNLSSALFKKRLRHGNPLYDARLLSQQVREDTDLISKIRPDAVIGDFRLSLAISARICDIPYLTITNAHWDRIDRSQNIIPETPLTKLLPIPIANILFRSAYPFISSLHVRPHNALRAAHALPPISRDLGMLYTDADHVLYADLPELYPTYITPPNRHFIGPILWSPSTPEDPDMRQAKRPGTPLVYFSLGTSSDSNLIPAIFRALGKLPITVIASMAGARAPKDTPANIFTAPYLSGERSSNVADLVVCNGGSGTTYQALAAGKPIIGIASNLDQLRSMERVVGVGAGILLRADRLTTHALETAILRVLDTQSFKTSAERIRDSFPRHDFRAIFPPLLEHILERNARIKTS